MKGTDLPRLTATVSPAATNGTHRAAKRNGAAPKRSSGSGGSGARADALPLPQPLAAAFAIIGDEPGDEPIDAPKWPLHPAAWFQPELAPSVPVRSGLAIERHNRIPAPDFLHSGIAPADRPEGLHSSPVALTACGRRELPQSGLAPLGWDPRAVCRKEGGE